MSFFKDIRAFLNYLVDFVRQRSLSDVNLRFLYVQFAGYSSEQISIVYCKCYENQNAPKIKIFQK